MNSSWNREIRAILRKEVQSELRNRSGLTTSALFSLVTVVTISFASYNEHLDKNMAAALLWIAILFACVLSLPRTFIGEEEMGTGDLLRLTSRPHAIFWGKAIFNVGQAIVTGLILSFLFFGFTQSPMKLPLLYAVSLIGGCSAVAGSVTLCGALVSRAANRHALAGAVAVPLLLPLVALGISGMRVAIGPFETDMVYLGGVKAGIGLVAYAVATLTMGPFIYAAVWKS